MGKELGNLDRTICDNINTRTSWTTWASSWSQMMVALTIHNAILSTLSLSRSRMRKPRTSHAVSCGSSLRTLWRCRGAILYQPRFQILSWKFSIHFNFLLCIANGSLGSVEEQLATAQGCEWIGSARWPHGHNSAVGLHQACEARRRASQHAGLFDHHHLIFIQWIQAP